MKGYFNIVCTTYKQDFRELGSPLQFPSTVPERVAAPRVAHTSQSSHRNLLGKVLLPVPSEAALWKDW